MSLFSNWHFSKIDLLLFCLLFLSRLVFVVIVPEIVISTDSQEYLELARSLSTTGEFARNYHLETFRTPGYPFFLYSIDRFLGMESPREIAVIQLILFMLESWLLFLIARNRFGEREARIVLLILLLNPGNIVRITHILSESLFVFFLILLMWIWTMHPMKVGMNELAMGLCSGILCLIRPIATWIFIPLWMAILFQKKSRDSLMASIGLVLVGILLTQGLWLIRNYRTYGSWYISEISAASIYVYWAQAITAHHPELTEDEIFDAAWKEWDRSALRLSPPEMRQEYTRKAMEILSSHKTMLLKVFFHGIIRQIMDSSLTKLISSLHPTPPSSIPLSLREIYKSLVAPSSPIEWMRGGAILVIRLLEWIFYIAILIGTCLTGIRYGSPGLDPPGNERSRQSLVRLGILIVLYLGILSAAPSANERFREQYMSLAILLSVPEIDRFCDFIRIRISKSIFLDKK